MKKYLAAFFLPFLILNCIYGQLCTGSLGDPVVNITFGNANTANGPLKPGVTNLSYTTGCPNDGQYTITNFSAGCFGNTWHTIASDHTGDAGGKLMLVNASFAPSDFYVDTVAGLCGNTVYEFAAWVVNVLKTFSCNGTGIKPNLTFKIETTTGTILKKFDSGDISADVSGISWKQFGTFFSTPAGVESVVLRITNNAPGGCGNDLALDDITFRPCGPDASVSIVSDGSKYLAVCENEQKDILVTTSYSAGFSDPILQWQVSADSGKTWIDIVGEQNISYNRKPTSSGYYQYRVTIAERSNFVVPSCRVASKVIIISVNPIPNGPTMINVTGCTGNYVKLGAFSDSTFTYQWSAPNGVNSTLPFIIIPAVAYKDSGLYKLVIKSLKGCKQTDTLYLKVYPNAKAIVSPDVSVCEGTGIILTASGGIQYDWTPASGLSDTHVSNPLALPADTTAYKIIVTNQYGCRDSAQTTVNIWKKPVVNAGPDYRIFEGQSVNLNGMVSGTSISFSWMPTIFMLNSNTLLPTVSPIDNTVYTLYGVSDLGCGTASDNTIVKVYKKLNIPNIFSPNGDGINDTWIINGLDTYPESVLKVFSRNGLVVFQAKAVDRIWDGTYNGKPLPVATYYYLIDLNIGQPPLSGWVVIIR